MKQHRRMLDAQKSLVSGLPYRLLGRCSGAWRIASVLLFLCLSVRVASQSDAFARTDSNYAETGNPFVIHLAVPQSAGKPGQVDFSVWEESLPEQNILQQTEWAADGQQFIKDLTVVFFDADSLSLPPLPIRLNGQSDPVMTNSLQIVVLPTPSPDDLVDMSDIKDIRREPAHWTDYLPWALAVAALALLVMLASWLMGRAQNRKRQAALSRTVGLPPHELAWKKLDALMQKRLWDKGLVKEYCAETTFIIREYLEKRYEIPALESTSEEIVVLLQKTDFPQPLRSALQELLKKADLVKFAKATPPDTFHEEAMSFARKIILETKPLPAQPVNHPTAPQ